MKMYVFLGCEREYKYMQYKNDLNVIESGNTKCNCHFRLRGVLIKDTER